MENEIVTRLSKIDNQLWKVTNYPEENSQVILHIRQLNEARGIDPYYIHLSLESEEELSATQTSKL